MPTDLSELCQQCKSKYEQSINNLLKINKELEINNQLLQQEINQMATAEPDIRDKIIALIAPAIEFKEQFYVNGEYEELVTLYRTYNPKKESEQQNE